MLLPLLAGAAAVAAAAALAWYLWKKIRNSQEEQQQEQSGFPGNQGEGGGSRGDNQQSGPSQEERERRAREDMARKNELLRSIVKSIEFSTREVVSDIQLPGTLPRQSIVPTSNYNVRPIKGAGEFSSILPSAHMLDDEQFYGRLSANNLLVSEYHEYYGSGRRVLFAAFDGSGSMEKYGRAQWAIGLCEAIIDRCIEQQAELYLLVYSGVIKGVYHVFDRKSAEAVKRKLREILSPEGGTDINLALDTIFDMIKSGKFDEARALLVTDGTESVDEEHILQRRKTEKVFLHTVSIAGERDDLRRVSSRFDQLAMFSGS
ncbi:VWA domain-containing protein [Candidatus Falkowbacteria bacterium]|nr:VWA domain-containing protein [Candidatus Falkowbacteria bacterium]